MIRVACPIFIFNTGNHIAGLAEARVIKFCVQAVLCHSANRGIIDYPIMCVVSVTRSVFYFAPYLILELVKLCFKSRVLIMMQEH